MITIVGGTGFVGTHLTQRLRRGGEAVRAVARRPQADPADDVELVRGHIEEAETAARCVRDVRAGVRRFVHVSAMGAAADAPAIADGSKAAGERAVMEALPTANIVRPALVFGPAITSSAGSPGSSPAPPSFR